MSSPRLTVSRRVVAEMIREAALEVPGVLGVSRGGPRWRAWFAGPPVRTRIRDRKVEVRLWLVARPGQGLEALARDVRDRVGATIERLLGLEPGEVVVLVDGVGAAGR